MLLRYVTGDLVRMPDRELDCELAHLPGSSDILGRYAGPASLRLLTRPLLEVLEGRPELPLPCRYALIEQPELVLHVWSSVDDPMLRAELHAELNRHGLPVADVRLYLDRAELPPTAPVRADLREHAFEAARMGQQLVGGAA
jgi:hypothetical protein